MPAALLRHGVVVLLAIGAVWAQGIARATPVADNPVAWMALSIVLGVLAAIVARGLMGAVFLVVGLVVGVELLLAHQTGDAAEAAAALRRDGWLYAALIAVALEAYLIALLILMRFRRA
jgi:hypothetical protein